MEDITPLTSAATSTPEQAASNIQAANVFAINPTSDKDINADLISKSKQLTAPTEAEPPIADHMAQSTEHAAVVSSPGDLSKLNYISRLAKYFGDKIGGQYTVGQETSELAVKKLMNNGVLNDEDTGRLWELNQQKKELAERNYDLTGPEKPPRDMFDFDVGGIAKDTTKFVTDVAADTINFGRSAVRGAYEGFINSPPGDIQKQVANAALGALQFKHIVGATYNELPDNMDEATKRHIAIGMGAVHSGVNAAMTFGGGLVGKALPFLNTSLSPKFVAMAMEAPENAVLKMAINNIGHSAVMMGTAGGIDEAAQIVQEEMVKNYDGTHSSFVNAMVTAAEKTATNADNYASRIGGAIGKGATTGVLLSGLGNLAGRGKLRSQVDAVAERGQEFIDNVTITRTGSPAGLIEGDAPPRPASKPGTPPPEPRPPMKDVTPIRPDVGDEVPVEHTVQQAHDSLEFHEGLHTINDVINSTKLSGISPQETAGVLKRIFDHSGITKLYTTMSNVWEFTKSPEQAIKMRNVLDPSGKLNNLNTPIAVDPVMIMDIAKTSPEILDHVSVSPTMPTALQSKTHLENLQKAETRRVELLSKLGVTAEDVGQEPESNVKELPKAKPKEAFDVHGAYGRAETLLNELKVEQAKRGTDETEPTKKEKQIQKQLDDLKAEVVKGFKNPEVGKVLFGHWAEPGLDESTNAMSGYLESPTFTDALRKALPKAEVDRIDQAQQRAREARAMSIVDAAKYEMDKVQDVNVEEVKDLRRQQELNRIANDPNYKIVDKFRNTKDSETKKSIYQIDPKSLTKEQLAYADHYRMKEHGVFAKPGKGQPADSIAQLLEVKDGTELLRILAETPSREQVARARAEANAVADEKEIRSQDDLNHVKIIEAIRDTARNHLEEMKFMREQEWPATKAGIKRIALPLPKIEALEEKARQIVSTMKVGDLNARVFEIGESRSNRAAVNAILKNEVESAFQHKENAALNALIRKEVMVQTGLANRAFSFFRKVNKASTQQLLRDAGKLPYEAMKELQDLWKLSPSTAGQSELGSFRKWIKRELEAGRGDHSIPERLSDLRQSANDMTVEQLMVVWDRGRTILNEAKFKNTLRGMGEARAEEAHKADIERIEAEVVARVKARRGSDVSRVEPPSGPINWSWRKFKNTLSSIEAGMVGKQNVIRELDDGKTGGFFHETFNEMFEGSGKFLDKTGFTKAQKGSEKIHNWLYEASRKVPDFDVWEKTWFDVSEFQGIKELKNGKLTKADLAKAYVYRGQQYTKDLLFKNNGGVTDETWNIVHSRYLKKIDVEFLHTVVDKYKEFRPEIKAQQERDGRDVTFIEGIPITHTDENGVTTTRMGGWVRARYEREFTRGAAEQLKDFLDNKDSIQDEKKQGASYGHQYAAETTHQGYLEERKGSNMPLDLSFRGLFDGFHEINHDLAYRDAGRNFMELMSRPVIYDSFVEAVGKPKTDFLIQAAIKLLDQPAQRNEGYFSNFNRLVKDGYRKLGRNYAITALWGNSSVVIKQTESLAEQFNHLGPKGLFHFVRNNYFLLRNLDKIGSYFKIAETLDPNMRRYFSGAEDTAASTIEGLVPRKSIIPKKLNWLSNAGKMAETAGFTPIALTDYYLKGLQAITHLTMALGDDHPDIRAEDLAKLSDEEQIQKIQSIIQQSSTLTQIQSRPELQAAVQDHLAVKPFILFWNYQRNILNNTFLDARRSKWKYQDSYESFKEGEKMDAAKEFGSATGIVLSRMLWATVGIAITKYASGQAWNLGKKAINGIDDLAEAGFDFVKHMAMSPFEQVADAIPIESAVKWGVEHKRKYQQVEVNNPLTQAMSSLGTCYSSLDNMMSLSRHMTRMQVRACMQAESYFIQPLPVNGYYKAMKWLSKPDSASQGIMSLKNVDNLIQNIKEYVANPPSSVDKEDVASLDKIGKDLSADSTEIPKGMADSVKLAASGGDWSKPNGMYGFSSEQWKSIQKSAPELGLTDAGRIAKDTSQQEKAIEWSLKDNAQKLSALDIPVNQSTLYAAHKLGVDNYDKLFKAPGDAKLKTVLGGDVLAKNPDLAQFKTVGQVKAHLNSVLDQARKSRQETANLTKPTNNAED